SKRTKNKIFNNYSKYYSKRPDSISTCFADDCEAQTIYSHSISKNAVLKNISTNGLVCSPLIKNQEICMREIGIESQASVFPAFCNPHDTALFSELDKPNTSDFSRAFFEQLILRTISREIYTHRRNLKMTENVINQANSEFENAKIELFSDFNNILRNTKINIKEWNDSRCLHNKYLADLNEKLENDKVRLKSLLDFYIGEKPETVRYLKIHKSLPVAFSGLTNFYENGSEIQMIINCLPYKDLTILAIANSSENDNIIQNQIFSKYDLSNENSVLKLVETLAVNGTDNIFFDIKYWKSLPTEISKKYLADFSNFNADNPRKNLKYSFLKWNYK
ncbi:MAG: hypothetical protein COA80_20230, partial [Leeuwenhoekiella sp.]